MKIEEKCQYQQRFVDDLKLSRMREKGIITKQFNLDFQDHVKLIL